MTFYQELDEVFSLEKAWEFDCKRVIRMMIETGICAAFFIVAVILMFVL